MPEKGSARKGWCQSTSSPGDLLMEEENLMVVGPLTFGGSLAAWRLAFDPVLRQTANSSHARNGDERIHAEASRRGKRQNDSSQSQPFVLAMSREGSDMK